MIPGWSDNNGNVCYSNQYSTLIRQWIIDNIGKMSTEEFDAKLHKLRMQGDNEYPPYFNSSNFKKTAIPKIWNKARAIVPELTETAVFMHGTYSPIKYKHLIVKSGDRVYIHTKDKVDGAIAILKDVVSDSSAKAMLETMSENRLVQYTAGTNITPVASTGIKGSTKYIGKNALGTTKFKTDDHLLIKSLQLNDKVFIAQGSGYEGMVRSIDISSGELTVDFPLESKFINQYTNASMYILDK